LIQTLKIGDGEKNTGIWQFQRKKALSQQKSFAR